LAHDLHGPLSGHPTGQTNPEEKVYGSQESKEGAEEGEKTREDEDVDPLAVTSVGAVRLRQIPADSNFRLTMTEGCWIQPGSRLSFPVRLTKLVPFAMRW